ncbi:methyl-accepting chemotaxis protein [Alkalimarinus sediminis]|uniref:Methyl-accepting chemotaxis protein n=1 Tax=Alkalimarinus sediminis TaxID=1632866 RepID=A0A9E8HG33_9ALTE|nr:methyl-accepting chemotaxis protein [Alkalimarinus sediminis]UZW73577.1 methyl-accepting chemotaxis protein [Alkalimarinus sediminis]
MWSRLSIQHKITAITVTVLIISLAISATFNNSSSRTLISDRLEHKELPSVLREIGNKIEKEIYAPINGSMAIAQNAYFQRWVAAGEPATEQQETIDFLLQTKQTTSASVAFYVSNISNNYYTEKGVIKQVSKNNEHDQWFYGFIKENAKYTINLDYFEGDGPLTLFVNYPVRQSGQVVGAAGLGINVNLLSELIQQFKIEKSGYVFLVDSNGKVVIHPNRETTDKPITTIAGVGDISAKLLKGNDINRVHYETEGSAYVAASSPVPNLDYRLVAVVPEAELYESLNEASLRITLLTLAIITVFAVVVMMLAKTISSPIKATANLLKEISEGDGDLTQTLRVTSQDEVGSLCESFNNFEDKLRHIIQAVSHQAGSLLELSEQVKRNAQKSSSAVESQKVNIESVASAITEMGSTIQEIAGNANQAASAAADTKDKSEQGQKAVQNSIGEIQQLSEEIINTSEVIVDLGKQTEQIGSILEVIRGISEQTNLLALNAAIEAARAGEQGRGFAVVADEVRGLAGRTAESTNEIERMIDALQKGSSSAVNAMKKGETMTKAGVESIHETGSVLTDIFNSVDTINDINFQVATATEEQSQVVEEITRHITQVEEISMGTLDAANEVRELSDQLSSLSTELSSLMSQFKTE